MTGFTRRSILGIFGGSAMLASDAAITLASPLRPFRTDGAMPIDDDDLPWVRSWLEEHYKYECGQVSGIRDQFGDKIGWDALAETLMHDGFIDSLHVVMRGARPDATVMARIRGYWCGVVAAQGFSVPHALSKATVKAICVAARKEGAV